MCGLPSSSTQHLSGPAQLRDVQYLECKSKPVVILGERALVTRSGFQHCADSFDSPQARELDSVLMKIGTC